MKNITVEEIKEFLSQKGVGLENEEEYLKKQYFFNTCREITGHKLNNLELMVSNENMIDLITNNRPDLELIHHHTQLIAVQYKYYEKFSETKGKLTKDEKTKLAFANFASIYIAVYDLESKKQRSILDNFETVEEFEKLFKQYKGRSQIMFAYLDEDEQATGNIN